MWHKKLTPENKHLFMQFISETMVLQHDIPLVIEYACEHLDFYDSFEITSCWKSNESFTIHALKEWAHQWIAAGSPDYEQLLHHPIFIKSIPYILECDIRCELPAAMYHMALKDPKMHHSIVYYRYGKKYPEDIVAYQASLPQHPALYTIGQPLTDDERIIVLWQNILTSMCDTVDIKRFEAGIEVYEDKMYDLFNTTLIDYFFEHYVETDFVSEMSHYLQKGLLEHPECIPYYYDKLLQLNRDNSYAIVRHPAGLKALSTLKTPSMYNIFIKLIHIWKEDIVHINMQDVKLSLYENEMFVLLDTIFELNIEFDCSFVNFAPFYNLPTLMLMLDEERWNLIDMFHSEQYQQLCENIHNNDRFKVYSGIKNSIMKTLGTQKVERIQTYGVPYLLEHPTLLKQALYNSQYLLSKGSMDLSPENIALYREIFFTSSLEHQPEEITIHC